MNAIRQTQQGNKSSRNAIHETIKKYDEQLKSRLNELKTSKGKVNFKSVEDIDREIARLQKQVDGGMMKLVDEKKALSEITTLNKARKQFSGFDDQQKDIDALKAKIAEQKKLLDDPEQKALSDKYTKLQTELDQLKAEQDAAFKDLRSLREETDKARAEQQEKYQKRKELKDAYYQQKRAFQEYEFQARKIRNEKRRQEQIQYVASKRKEAANKRLEEASAPAYYDEILATEGLIRHFDPSALPAKETTSASKFAASTQRTVDDSGFKGVRVGKKNEEEENYFVGGGGKKGKKGKKTAAAEKFNLNMGIIEELAKVGLDAPASQADVPATVEKLKEKLAFWKSDQDRKTKEVSLLRFTDFDMIVTDDRIRTLPRHKRRLNVLRPKRTRLPMALQISLASPRKRTKVSMELLQPRLSLNKRRMVLRMQLRSLRRPRWKTKKLLRHKVPVAYDCIYSFTPYFGPSSSTCSLPTSLPIFFFCCLRWVYLRYCLWESAWSRSGTACSLRFHLLRSAHDT